MNWIEKDVHAIFDNLSILSLLHYKNVDFLIPVELLEF